MSSSKPISPSSEEQRSPNTPQLASLPAAPPQPEKRFLDHFPSWVATNIRSTQSLKVLFRCWLACWVAFILILPNKTLKTMGNACVSCSLWKYLWTIFTFLLAAIILFVLVFDTPLTLSSGRIPASPHSVIEFPAAQCYSSSFARIISSDWIEC